MIYDNCLQHDIYQMYTWFTTFDVIFQVYARCIPGLRPISSYTGYIPGIYHDFELSAVSRWSGNPICGKHRRKLFMELQCPTRILICPVTSYATSHYSRLIKSTQYAADLEPRMESGFGSLLSAYSEFLFLNILIQQRLILETL